MSDELAALLEEERSYQALGLSLDMTRGKPCPEQLKLSESIATMPLSFDEPTEEGTDLRNYGNPFGLLECKRLMGSLVDVPPENVMVLGNSSLATMFSAIDRGYTHGYAGCAPWKDVHVKWLCPVPGYDRHFAVTEYFGFEMINVPLYPDGPDMDMVEELVNNDPSVKGIWCVPKYSNPSGYVYSEEVVHRFAKLRPAAKDFRVFWDNAYFVHDFHFPPYHQSDLLLLAMQEGKPDMVLEFLSFSKITFPGSAIVAILAGEGNQKDLASSLKIETIGFDKMNQMRHCLFFKDKEDVWKHMEKHAAILRPKFELAERILSENLQGYATWFSPKGGYFIALNVDHCASEALARCEKLGVHFTKAGAAFPYGKDPENSTIRIAPTYPSLGDLEKALRVLCCAVKIETLLRKASF